MGKLDDFIEKRGGLMIMIFLAIQTIIYIAFTIMFFINNEDSPVYANIFVCVSLLIFQIYMIHFAYHSVNHCNIDR
jgi:membrane protein YdbS with pleckstrin-like domain